MANAGAVEDACLPRCYERRCARTSSLFCRFAFQVPSCQAVARAVSALLWCCAFVWAASIPMAAVLLVAMFTVHLPYGFSSIKLIAVTAAGAQFGPPGYEIDLLYIACLAALVIGGSGPFSLDGVLAEQRYRSRGGLR